MTEFLIIIRKQLKLFFDGIRNERLKNNLLQAIPFWIASLLTGLVAVGYTKLFAFAEEKRAILFHHGAWLFFILTPFCFVAAWWVVQKYSPYARGSGIPQIMASIELATPREHNKVDRMLSLRIIFIKILSSLVMVFGGGIIGREGPTIQIAGSIFRKVNQWLPKWWPSISRRNMIMTGAAAGLAAAFNTPLGGIVFAVEELTKTHISHFKTALFTAVIIAGLTAQGLLGPYLYLGYPVIKDLSSFIIVGVLAVSLVAGMSGSIMAKLMWAILRWKDKFKSIFQQVGYVIGCALLIAAAAFFIDEGILGSGKGLMTTTLFTAHKSVPAYMPFLRMLGSVLSFTTGVSGGIFAPSLSAGASVGAACAGWFHLSDSNTNLLILSGMVAFLTGVTRTPFTSAILVLEMTDRHNVIFYLMLAGMVASLVSMAIDRHSIYDHLKIKYIRDLRTESIEIPANNLPGNSVTDP